MRKTSVAASVSELVEPNPLRVLTGLGGRTAEQALADGEEPKAVWQAVCEAFDVPERLR